jgi:hypothetical protein
MRPAAITSAHVALPQRRNRLLAVALAAVLAAGAASAASSGLQGHDQPTGPVTWPAGPIRFDDPAVVKGARGGKKNAVAFPLFGDPTVRKGAGGRR